MTPKTVDLIKKAFDAGVEYQQFVESTRGHLQEFAAQQPVDLAYPDRMAQAHMKMRQMLFEKKWALMGELLRLSSGPNCCLATNKVNQRTYRCGLDEGHEGPHKSGCGEWE